MKLGKAAIAAAVVVVLAAFAWLTWQAEMKRRTFIQAAFITQAFDALNVTKMRVVAFRDERGRWPSSNEELGIPPPSDFASGAISELRVSEGGVITATFNEKSGVNNGTLRLTPHVGMDVRWQCTKPSFKDIERWAPQCSYRK